MNQSRIAVVRVPAVPALACDKLSIIFKDANNKLLITRRLKSFPWDALVYGRIMAFYLNLEKLGNTERCVML